MGGSALIRGEQIAKYLNAKYNPTEGYENDVCIYVKPAMKLDGSPRDTFMKNSYIDVIDFKEYIDWLRQMPKVAGIFASEFALNHVKKLDLKNKLIYIPQQHCNFERFVRTRSEIKNVGIIGGPRAFRLPIDEVRDRLSRIGLNLFIKDDYQSRDDVVNFYKEIDIQIIWDTLYTWLKNPLKIVNAASFGIPTVGYPHKGYMEVEGFYTKSFTLDELIEQVEKLKNPENYQAAIAGPLKMAEKYHISKIAEKYLELDKLDNLS